MQGFVVDDTPERQLRWLAAMLLTTHGADAVKVARKLLERTIAGGDTDAAACWAAVLVLLDGAGPSPLPAGA